MNPYDVFYSWEAHGPGDGRGVCGVTDRPDQAQARLSEALDALALGAAGSVEIVRLDRAASQPSYLHGVVLLRVRRREHGDVVLVEGE